MTTDLVTVNKWSEDYKKTCELIHRAILASNSTFPREIEFCGMVLEKRGNHFSLKVNLKEVDKITQPTHDERRSSMAKNKRWAQAEKNARKALAKNSALIDATKTGIPSGNKPSKHLGISPSSFKAVK